MNFHAVMKKFLMPLALLACCLFPTLSAQAADATANGYLDHPEAQKFIAEIQAEQAYPPAKLKDLLRSATPQQSILEAIARPAEKTKTWAEYRPIFLTEERVNQGVEFYRQHESTLVRAEQEYGVSRYVILAIIGVETRYGKHMGRHRVIDALTTLAFDYPPRSAFFRSELKHFLQLEQEAGIDLNAAQGSYAGAMGYGQFIASSYRHYAVDFDGDGRRDLLHNPVDAIGSVANYFRQHGWRTGEPVASLARRLGEQARALEPLLSSPTRPQKPTRSILELKQAGLLPDADLPADSAATATRFLGKDGPEYWIGLQNFYVITRYNHSPLYAMAVYQLSEALQRKLSS